MRIDGVGALKIPIIPVQPDNAGMERPGLIVDQRRCGEAGACLGVHQQWWWATTCGWDLCNSSPQSGSLPPLQRQTSGEGLPEQRPKLL